MEGEQHLSVRAFCGALQENGGIPVEDGLREKEYGEEKGDSGTDCPEIVVPSPACFLT